MKVTKVRHNPIGNFLSSVSRQYPIKIKIFNRYNRFDIDWSNSALSWMLHDANTLTHYAAKFPRYPNESCNI